MLRRFRLPARLRAALLLALALCVVLQPALSAVGQVHDAFEHAGTQVHHETSELHGDEDGEAAGAMHFLMHYAHCCASATAAFPDAPTLVPAAVSSSLPSQTTGRDRTQTRPGYPFRPPIFA